MSRLCIEVEYTFAIYTNSWQLFIKISIMKIDSLSRTAYYLVVVLLSNIIKYLQETKYQNI